VAALCLIVDVQTYVRTDIFTGFIRSSQETKVLKISKAIQIFKQSKQKQQ